MSNDEYVAKKQQKDFEEGKKPQKLFADLMQKNGFRCYSATSYQDKYEHWDILTVEDLGNGTKVFERSDIKGLKNCVKEGFEWMELQTIDGRMGWLYSEFTDNIIFEIEDCFLFIKRAELLPIIVANVAKMDKLDEEDGERPPVVHVIKDGLKYYQRYCRILWGNTDITVMSPFTDFQHLIYMKLYKADGKIEKFNRKQ
jgi:hypothetical protein